MLRNSAACVIWTARLRLFPFFAAGQEADFLENSLDQDDSEGKLEEFMVTDFTVYCEFGHVIAFDSDLIKRGKELFIAGKVSQFDQPRYKTKIGPLTCWKLELDRDKDLK